MMQLLNSTATGCLPKSRQPMSQRSWILGPVKSQAFAFVPNFLEHARNACACFSFRGCPAQPEEEMDSLEKLFEETTRDIYYAEKKILKALPKMAKKASSPKLAAAFEAHIAETEAQVERLEEIFELIGKGRARQDMPCHR